MINGREDEIDTEAQLAHHLLWKLGILPSVFAEMSYREKIFIAASVDVQREINKKIRQKANRKKGSKRR